MFAPIARVSDMHTCPMLTPGTPPIPHVGGPALPPGAPTVLAGGMPVAVLGGMAVCSGSPAPDALTLGSFTVTAGGKPVVRVGDVTAHGGTVIVGLPTVMVGDSGGAGGAAGQTMSAAKAAGRGFVRKNCGAGPAKAARAQAEPTEANGDAWIEVAVVDLDGRPIPYQAVQVKDPEGRVHNRFSDADGLVRISGVRPGQCEVTLPDLDSSSWDLA